MKTLVQLIRLIWKDNKFLFLFTIILSIFTSVFTLMQAEIGQAFFSAINTTSSSESQQKLTPDKNNLSSEDDLSSTENNQLKIKSESKFKLFINALLQARSLKDFLVVILNQRSIELVLLSGLVFLIFYFIFKLIMYLQNYAQIYISFEASLKMQKEVFSKLLNLPSLYFRKEGKSGDLISRLIHDINSIRDSLVNIINTIFFLPVITILSLILLFKKNHIFTLILLVLGSVGFILINRIALLIKGIVTQNSKRMANTANHINQTIYGIDVIKIFNAKKYEEKKFSELLKSYAKSYKKLISISLLERPVTELIGALIIIVLLLSGSILIWRDELTMDQIVGFILYLVVLAPNLQNVSKILFQLNTAEGANIRIQEILSIDEESKYFGSEILENYNGNICFSDVSFSYEKEWNLSTLKNTKDKKKSKKSLAELHALKNISVKINEGEFIALVGPSGAGKSTFVSLIPGLIFPSSGKILFDGKDYQSYTLESIRSYISLVPQEVTLFPDTIFNNIAFANPEAKEDEIYYFASLAHAHEFITNLPDGYNTILGERGINLSGGQKQRIAIARALLKKPKILIFDEATSSLDSESEKAIQNAMESIMHNQTTIVIAHRLSTILKADRIIVLNKGELVEQGNHQQLIKENGLYKKLYDSQFKSLNV